MSLAARLLDRSGALSALPKALARMNGAALLARSVVERTPAPVAPCPAVVIGGEGAARLLRYERKPGAPRRDPILLCPSVINRLYVLDLKSGISVVEQLLLAGHDVYGIDWGEPGDAEAGVGFEGFTHRLGRLLDAACQDAGTDKMHVLGHCLGGTMAVALAATDDARVQSLTLLTAPLAFHDTGLLSAWTRAPFFDAEKVVQAFGHVPAWLTQPAFQLLKPMGQPSKLLRLYQSLDKPEFLEFFRCLETWINDNVSIPGAFFVDLVNGLYRRDALLQDALLFKDGPVHVDNVRVPVLVIAAEHDHIVPPASATEGVSRFRSVHKQVEVLPGGHIGVVVGGLARRRLWPALLGWLAAHPIAAQAPAHPASHKTNTHSHKHGAQA